MSTLHQERASEEKHADTRPAKDDFKQQSSLKKRESKDLEEDSGSSLVGGTVSAVQHAVESVVPESVQRKAADLQQRAAEAVKPVSDAYQKEGVIAAAKTAGEIGVGAVSSLASSASSSAGAAKDKAVEKVEETVEPKKHRRRRGGRGHGNRKMKTRELPVVEGETIADTLGDKAKELKEVVVSPPAGSTGKAQQDEGIMESIRHKASDIMQSVSSTASGFVAGASSKASELAADASSRAQDAKRSTKAAAQSVKNTAQQKISSTNPMSKGNPGPKPSLERKDELAALGTPESSSSSLSQRSSSSGSSSDSRPSDREKSSMLHESPPKVDAEQSVTGKVSSFVESARNFVADKLDEMSMNADDTEPMEDVSQQNESALDKAKQQLDKIADSVSQTMEQSGSNSSSSSSGSSSRSGQNASIQKQSSAQSTKQQ